MNKVVVIIPVYKEFPSDEEKKSMVQTLKILGKHPIKIIGPEKINYTEYLKIGFSEGQITRLENRFFNGIAGYNKMLCSRWFYELFKNYEYIFIMQNDAWVFRDELITWCDKAFDYIGSPWLWKPEQTKKKVFIELFPIMKGEIGNGGVSLRKTDTFIKYGGIASTMFSLIKKNEDFIWLLVAKLPFVKLKKPEIIECLRFCIEMQPEEALSMIDGQLPFTVHAYERYGKEFWAEYMN